MKRIGMILFEYILGYSALVINSALMLERAGYEVHIFIDAPTYERGKIQFERENIVLHVVDVGSSDVTTTTSADRLHAKMHSFASDHVRRGRLVTQQPLFRTLWSRTASLYSKLSYRFDSPFYDESPSLEKLQRETAYFFPNLVTFCQKITTFIDETYTCLLGIDVKGFVVATLVGEDTARVARVPTVYYNMELLLERHANTLQLQVLKSLERSCLESCYFIVIQDEQRGTHFVEDTQVPKDKLVYVPVSGAREVHQGNSDYFRNRFGIRPETSILLYAGHIMECNMCLELAEVANDWSEDLVLVLHSPTAYINRAYLNKIKRIARPEKVYLSLSPVEWTELPNLLSSADIGLIFHKDINPNFRETGRSSNKLVQYLHVGLPIIVAAFPSTKRMLEECQCGESTSNLSDIEALARKILSEYDTYRYHAFKCYTEKYDISHYFGSVLERIRQIEQNDRLAT